MDTKNRTIVELEKKCNELKNNIALIETKLGFAIFSKKICNDDNFLSYSAFEQEKKHIRGKISDIQEIVAEQKASKETYAEIQKHIDTIQEQKNKAYVELAKNVYVYYNEKFAPFFAGFYEEIQQAQTTYSDLDTQMQEYKKEAEQANFVNKLVKQVKITSLQNALTSQKKKIDALYLSIGEKLWNLDNFHKDCDTQSFSISLLKVYEECADLQQSEELDKKSLAEIEQLQQAFKEKLLSLNVHSVEKKVAELENDILEQQKQEDALAQSVGHNFANAYITHEGETLKDSPVNFQEFIDEIQKNRIEFLSCKRKIDILYLTRQIDEAENRIESMKKDIQDTRNKIIAMEEHIEEVSEIIKNATDLRDELIARRNNIEVDENGKTRYLESEKNE